MVWDLARRHQGNIIIAAFAFTCNTMQVRFHMTKENDKKQERKLPKNDILQYT